MSRWLEALWYPPEGAAASPPLALELASFGFGATVRARNRLYDRGLLPARRVEGARVVSVGNVNVGGTGKTPAVLLIGGWARACGRKVAVLSRGYRREERGERVFRGDALPEAREVGDEPRLLAARLVDVPVLVGPDRARLAERARAELGCDFIVLDDGLQHRRLHRDVEVVVVDEDAGFGNGRLLPAGPLREPLEVLERADVVWLRQGAPGRPALPLPEGKVVRCRHRADRLVSPGGTLGPASALAGQKVVAVAGIARPASFLGALDAAGATVVERLLFPDHHPFSAAELAGIAAAARARGAKLVTTEKDLQRLPASLEAWALRVEVDVVSGLDRLAAALGLDPAKVP